ncbi:MAG: PAS domain S-box protein [Actinomycetota bacterium]
MAEVGEAVARELVETLLARHPSIVLIIDPDSERVVDANEAAVAFYGWSAPQLRGRHLSDINTLSPEQVRAEVDRARREQRNHFHFRHRLASGAVRDVEVTSGPFALEGRTLLYSIVTDVTERSRELQQLRESEELSRSIIDHAPVGIAIAGADGRIVDANDTLAKITGYPREELLGRDYVTLSHPEDRPATLEQRRTLVAEQVGVYGMRKRYLRADGSVAHVEVASSLLRAAGSREPYQLGIVHDVSDRVRAEHDLEVRAARQAALAELSKRAVLEADTTVVAAEALAMLARLLGVERAAVLRLEAPDAPLAVAASRGWPAEEARRLARVIDADCLTDPALTEGGCVVLEDLAAADCPGCRRRGTALVESGVRSLVSVGLVAREERFGLLEIHDAEPRAFTAEEVALCEAVGGVLAGALARERAEAQLRQAQKLEVVGRLASGVAHDVNNVLTVMLGHTELLERRADLDAHLREGLARIRDAGQRGVALSRKALSFAREGPSAGERVALGDLLEEFAPLLEAVLGPGVTLDRAEVEAWPVVPVERNALGQVLLNLAVNARDAMPGGGTVWVSTRIDGGEVVLTVADDGVGIAEDVRPRVREPFFTTKGPDAGTGLGLSIVDTVVAAAGGRLEIDSAPAAGTAVRLHLPLVAQAAREEAAAEPGGARPRAAPAPAARVLVVEDDEAIGAFVGRALRGAGHDVEVLASAEEALGRLEAAPPDLLVTDVSLPGLRGPELVARARRWIPDLAVVLMTGNEMDLSGDERGQAGVLAKPFGIDELRARVSEALGRA